VLMLSPSGGITSHSTRRLNCMAFMLSFGGIGCRLFVSAG
jgi:hypothetical protein